MKLEFFIAGVQYRPREEINKAAGELTTGTLLNLIPEPDNKFDPNAVKIHTESGDIFLGYVPKKFSSEVAAAIEAGCEPCCTVVSVNPSAKTYEMFKVKITDDEELEIEEEPCSGCGDFDCTCIFDEED